MKALFTSLAVLFMVAQASSQPNSLLAWYPLNGTPNDTTGRSAPMTLENTPFHPGGGIYCNGIYRNSGQPNWCDATTPILPGTIFQKFTVTFSFKVDSIKWQPVIVGGNGWRWIMMILDIDSTVALVWNNSSAIQRSAKRYTAGRWHDAALLYDSANSVGQMYLDGILAAEASFTLIHGPDYDRTFGITNYASGRTFQGYLKNVKIYSSSTFPISVEPNRPSIPTLVELSNSYPNPTRAEASVDVTLRMGARVTTDVIDLFGRRIVTLFDGELDAGTHTVRWNAHGCAAGVYAFRVKAGSEVITTPIVISD